LILSETLILVNKLSSTSGERGNNKGLCLCVKSDKRRVLIGRAELTEAVIGQIQLAKVPIVKKEVG
jgi:hypothetical protein